MSQQQYPGRVRATGGNTSQIVMALSRGRLLGEALELLQKIGVVPQQDPASTRALMIETTRPGLSLVVMRSSDVPACVVYGAADLGIVGSDVLMEKQNIDTICDPLGLGIGCCRLMLAAPTEQKDVLERPRLRRLRIATKFIASTKRYFAEHHGRQVHIIELGGAVEIAPALGIADAIVDLVESGRTLRENHLSPIVKIADINARVIVNRANQKIKNTTLSQLLRQLKQVAPPLSTGAASALLMQTVPPG